MSIVDDLSPVLGLPGYDIAAGNITDFSSVNKFGRSPNVDSGVDTDIWDLANENSHPSAAADNVAIWVAPTAARIHQIVSTSTDDDGDPAGNGARTIQVYGLTSWDSDETSEVITMNGTTNVPTSNSYVIIHRMKVLTKGPTNSNVGSITATADTDGTITALIVPGEGQTQMAIYGVPSTKTAYMTAYYASVNKKTSAQANISLLVNPEPDSELTNFLVKHTQAVSTTGANYIRHEYMPYNKISGPAIIKMQANGSVNDCDVSAGFDLILVSN